MSAWVRPTVTLLIAGGVAMASLLQWEAHAAHRQKGLLSVPPAQVARFGASGFGNLMADVLYMRFISYWGGQLVGGRNFHNMAPLLNLIVDLDPKFRSAYDIGSLALGDAGQPHEAVALLDKGARRHPRDWWYPYQAGLTLFFFSDDYLLAATYFEKAAALPNAPEEAGFFAARMYEKGQRRELALASWWGIYRESQDPSIREVAKRALIKLGERVPETEMEEIKQ